MIKRTFLIGSLLLGFNSITAQEMLPTEGVQYSNPLQLGSARYNAMGGSFGAIGGDISSIHINPAGSAVNVTNYATGGLMLNLENNQANYLGNNQKINKSNFNFSNVGAVFNFKNSNPEQSLKQTTLSFDVTGNSFLNRDVNFKGINDNSITEYFLQHANYGFNGGAVPINFIQDSNLSVGDLYADLNSIPQGFSAQQALLGFQSYLLDYESGNYVSSMANGPYLQEHYSRSRGSNNKITANIAFDFENRYYIGANLNYHAIDRRQVKEVYEGASQNNIQNGVTEVLFTNDLYTYGNGFSFNIGGMAKITEELRAGLSYQSPTWHNLNDEFEQFMETIVVTEGVSEYVDASPYIITVYDKYRLKTPGKINASLAYVFGHNGLVNIDYSRTDYTTMKYGKGDEFALINNFYKDQMQASNEIRIGGEYRINAWSLRGGYRWQQSPYKDEAMMDDLFGISAGFGYSFGNKRIDLAYMYAQQKHATPMITSGLNDMAKITQKNNMITVSYNVYF